MLPARGKHSRPAQPKAEHVLRGRGTPQSAASELSCWEVSALGSPSCLSCTAGRGGPR